MRYTCTICGLITDEQQCPEHRPIHPSRHWSKNRDSRKQANFRAAILKRDKQCRRCGSSEDLRAAHWPIPLRAYKRDDPEAYNPSNGILLCATCDKRMDTYAR